MKEKPIIFKREMVQAILAGTKTQTRRVVKPQPPLNATSAGWLTSTGQFHWLSGDPKDSDTWETLGDWVTAPYPPPIRLWVRETWAYSCAEDAKVKTVAYKADMEDSYLAAERITRRSSSQLSKAYSFQRWRSPIHLPRQYSRLLLEVTEIWAERLQDISGEDISQEGIAKTCLNGKYFNPKWAFSQLWDSIHPYSHRWDDNPWVWKITFNKVPE